MKTQELGSIKGFSEVLKMSTAIAFSGIDGTSESCGFDYQDIGVKKEEGTEVFDTFEGMSGGGVWSVPLLLPKGSKEISSVYYEEVLLTGVMFYQVGKKGEIRAIKAHGPKTVYEVVCEKLQEDLDNGIS